MKLCTLAGCTEKHKARGLCAGHYARRLRGADRSDPIWKRHGLDGTVIHRTWKNMRQRCNNPKSSHYADYGGRGITVCERWNGPDGLKNFVADMGLPPAGTSLDRRDVNGPYSPENCHWATYGEQRTNQRPRPRPATCAKGHPYTEQNTRWWKNIRFCRACDAARARERRAQEH